MQLHRICDGRKYEQENEENTHHKGINDYKWFIYNYDEEP